MSDLPSQNTIYIQLSTLRDTLDVTIISSSVNKIIVTKCTNVVLWFLKASQIRMRWNEKAVMLHFTHAYMQKIAKISSWGMYFLFLSATNKSQPWASKCLHGIWQNYVQRWISLFLHLFTCHIQENHEGLVKVQQGLSHTDFTGLSTREYLVKWNQVNEKSWISDILELTKPLQCSQEINCSEFSLARSDSFWLLIWKHLYGSSLVNAP